MEYIAQGAEGIVYSSIFLGKPVIVKDRISKGYRVPQLDVKLNKQRLLQEARCMVRCRRLGVLTPCIYMIDVDIGRIIMERVQGVTFKLYLKCLNENLNDAFPWVISIGSIIAKMHDADIVHGDLTTSNIMIKSVGNLAIDNEDTSKIQEIFRSDFHNNLKSRVVIIDFGLGTNNAIAEDKAVDLYVLERAFASTHPNSEQLVTALLESYKNTSTKVEAVWKKLEQVRLRGRKRDMFG